MLAMIHPGVTALLYEHISGRSGRPVVRAGRSFPMLRATSLSLVLAACGSSHREVAKVSAPGDGLCHEAGGCEAPVPGEPQFKLPDSDHDAPQDPALGVTEV